MLNNVLLLLVTYLKNRKQREAVETKNDVLRDNSLILIFIIYINDLLENVLPLKSIKYTDVTNIVIFFLKK